MQTRLMSDATVQQDAKDRDPDMAGIVHDADGADTSGDQPAPHETSLLIDIRFRGDEVLRVGRMLRAEADCKFSTFVHDLAMQAVADWEAKQAAEPTAVTAAD